MHKGSRELYFSLIAYCTNLLIELYKIKRLSKVYSLLPKKSNLSVSSWLQASFISRGPPEAKKKKIIVYSF